LELHTLSTWHNNQQVDEDHYEAEAEEGSVLLIFLVFVLSYYVSLRSEFCVVMSVTISA